MDTERSTGRSNGLTSQSKLEVMIFAMSLSLTPSPDLRLLYEQVEVALETNRQFLSRPDRLRAPDEYEESLRLLGEIASALQIYHLAVERLLVVKRNCSENSLRSETLPGRRRDEKVV
jgi:hypothetical protein